MLNINIEAPKFTLLDQNKQEVSLESFLGRKVIIYFYPKNHTEGCTLQAQSFAKLYGDFKELGYVVIGISKDTVSSHKKFCTDYNLPFILLSDPKREVLEAYDVIKPKMMYGKQVLSTHRTTYIINEQGVITAVFPDVDPTTSTATLLEQLKDN